MIFFLNGTFYFFFLKLEIFSYTEKLGYSLEKIRKENKIQEKK